MNKPNLPKGMEPHPGSDVRPKTRPAQSESDGNIMGLIKSALHSISDVEVKINEAMLYEGSETTAKLSITINKK